MTIFVLCRVDFCGSTLLWGFRDVGSCGVALFTYYTSIDLTSRNKMRSKEKKMVNGEEIIDVMDGWFFMVDFRVHSQGMNELGK